MKPDPTTTWVQRLNHIQRNLDAHAAAIHPMAWSEILELERELWRRVAARGP